MITKLFDNTIGTTLFGKTRRLVLALLYGNTNEAYYLRQIVRLTGVGLGPLQRELRQLTDAAIILRTIRGNQVYYQANPDSLIFNELKNIVRKTFGVADVIRKALEKDTDKIRVAFIFGSIARSADSKASDIDVMLIGEITFDEAITMLTPAEESLHREINIVVYPVSEFRKKIREDHYFVKTVLEEDKIFLIGDDNELGRLAE